MELTRHRLNVPEDVFVIGCAGVLACTVKRVDALVREVGALVRDGKTASGRGVYLLLAGAETDEAQSIERLASDLLPGRHRILKNVPFDQMPAFYRLLDLFVMPCAVEAFGIALVESMACGVPVVAHNSERLKWVVGCGQEAGERCQVSGVRCQASCSSISVVQGGDGTSRASVEVEGRPCRAIAKGESGLRRAVAEGECGPCRAVAEGECGLRRAVAEGEGGWCVNVLKEGFLSEIWDEVLAGVEGKRVSAREHAVRNFSWQAVYPQFIEMYERVAARQGEGVAK